MVSFSGGIYSCNIFSMLLSTQINITQKGAIHLVRGKYLNTSNEN